MSLLFTILSIFTWAALGFAVVMILINLFLARRRSWITAVIRISLTVITAIVSVPIARKLANVLTDVAYDKVMPTLEGVELSEGLSVGELLSAVPAGAEGARVLVSLLVAPLIFFLVFILLRGLLAIITSIVACFVPPLKEKNLRSVTMPVGAVNGLLIAMVVLIPLCGFMVVGGHMLQSAADTAQACNSPEVDAMLTDLGTDRSSLHELGDEFERHPVVLVVHSTIGRPVFKSLTTAELDSAETHNVVIKMNLEEELGGLVRAGVYVFDALDSFQKEDFTPEDKSKLFKIEENVLDSEWRTMMVTDLLTTAATSWRKGDAFLGVARPALDPAMDPTLNALLDILSKETVATLEADFNTILDVFGDFLVLDLLSGDVDPQEMLKAVSEGDLLNSTMDKLKANPRLAPLAQELKAMSIRLVSNMLGIEELKNGEHADMMNNVAAELTNVIDLSEEERHEVIHDALGKVFEEQGYEIPEKAAQELADEMIDQLGADGQITGDEVTDYLVNHVDDAADLIPDDIDPDDIPGDFTENLPIE